MTLDAKEIARLWTKGHNTAAIARMVNETEADVYNLFSTTREKLKKDGQSFRSFAKEDRSRTNEAKRAKIGKKEVRKKACLKCQEEFNSEGNSNRICEPCKETDEWG